MKQQKSQKSQPFTYPILATLAVIVLLNYLYRQPLYQMGIQLILKMQSKQSIILDWFFLLITMILDPTIVFALCIIMMIINRNKNKGFIMLIFILINTYFAALMKAFYSDPRPIWTNYNIRNIGFYCPIQYGNPSGHSWFSAVFGFGILLDYKGIGNNYIYLWISIAAVIFMPISRMYLGAHSLNQVLQGILFGLAMCLLYVTKLKQLIKLYLLQFNNSLIWKLIILGLNILYFIPYLAHYKQQLIPQWQNNILIKCNLQMNQTKLNNLMLIANALIVSIITGIGLGYKQLACNRLGGYYLIGNWQINQQKYQIKYGYILFIFVQCGCLISGLMIGGLVYYLVSYLWIVYIGICISGVISGYIYTAKCCVILEKYKIIREIQI